jgi:hypothetical protein
MKFSPLILFIILLFVLVFSTIMCKNCVFNSSEGFVSFQKDKYPIDLVSIPQYSKATKVPKLYDNLYFDNTNGNVIEVDGTYYGNTTSSGNTTTTGNVDTAGVSVTNTYVVTRDGKNNVTSPYTTTVVNGAVSGQDTVESKATMSSSFSSWVYKTQSSNTNTYQLFYIPWDQSTYIHVVELTGSGTYNTNTAAMNIYSYVFGSGSMDSHNHNSKSIAITDSATDTNSSNNNTSLTDSYYDPSKNLYQLNTYVKFDTTNGNLVIGDYTSGNQTGITVYDRSSQAGTSYTSTGQIKNTSSTVANVQFNPFIANANNQYQVVYMPLYQNTVVAVLQKSTSDSTQYTLQNVVRFNPSGAVIGSSSSTATATTTSNPSATTTSNTPSSDPSNMPWMANYGSSNMPWGTDMLNNPISDYYKWLTFWNTNQRLSEDYMLKTQIIPPVCPSCPSCPACTGNKDGGVCQKCGGNGGSGTIDVNGKTLVDGDRKVGNLLYSTGSGATNLVKSAGSGAKDLLQDTGSGVKNVAYDVAGGVKGVAYDVAGGVKNVAGGVKDVAYDVVGGVKNVAYDVVGGGANLIKSLGSGPTTVAGTSGTARAGARSGAGAGVTMGGAAGTNYPGGAPVGNGVDGVDNYSYYGALPSKGGNFMPITSDFSAFGK